MMKSPGARFQARMIRVLKNPGGPDAQLPAHFERPIGRPPTPTGRLS